VKAAFVLAAALLVLAPDPLHAHNLPAGVGGFSGGLLHPFVVPAHVIVLLALGLLIGQQEHRLGLLLALLAIGLLAGVVAVVNAVVAYEAERFVLATAAGCGVLVVLAWRGPIALSGALAMLAGIAVILDSVPEEISMATSALALAGTVISACVAVGFVAGVVATRRRDWERIGLRVLGAWITAGALLVLALRLSR
jgi:urease accessory protein